MILISKVEKVTIKGDVARVDVIEDDVIRDARRWRKLMTMSKSEVIDQLTQLEPAVRYREPGKVYSLVDYVDAAIGKTDK